MDHRSLLEMLREEEQICRELQTRINILQAAEEAEQEGRTSGEKHWELIGTLQNDVDKLCKKLFPLRGEIGGRLMDLQVVAEQIIKDRLYRAEAESGEAEQCAKS